MRARWYTCIAIAGVCVGLLIAGAGIFLYYFIAQQVHAGILDNVLVRDTQRNPGFQAWRQDYGDPQTHTNLYRSYWMWHLENLGEVLDGGRPSFRKQGPYVYHQIQDRHPVYFSPDASEVNFWYYLRWEYVPEMSVSPSDELDFVVNINQVWLGGMLQAGSEADLLAGISGFNFKRVMDFLTSHEFLDPFVRAFRPPTLQARWDAILQDPALAQEGLTDSLIMIGSATSLDECATLFPSVDSCRQRFEGMLTVAGLSPAQTARLMNATLFASPLNNDKSNRVLWDDACFSGNMDAHDILVAALHLSGDVQMQALCRWLDSVDRGMSTQAIIQHYQQKDAGVQSLSDLGYLQWGSGALTNRKRTAGLMGIDDPLGDICYGTWMNGIAFDVIDTATAKRLLSDKYIYNLDVWKAFLLALQNLDTTAASKILTGLDEAQCLTLGAFVKESFSTHVIPTFTLWEPTSGLFCNRSVHQWLFPPSTDPIVTLNPANLTQNATGANPSEPLSVMNTGVVNNDDLFNNILWYNASYIYDVFPMPTKVEGSDGTQFSPFMVPLGGGDLQPQYQTQKLWVEDLRRGLQINRVGTGEWNGVHVHRYILDSQQFRYNPDLNQLVDGMANMSSLHGAPIYFSKAEMYEVEQDIVDQVEGMSPTPENGESIVEIEPLTGSAFNAAIKMQLNTEIQKDWEFLNLPGRGNGFKPGFYPIFVVHNSGHASPGQVEFFKSQVLGNMRLRPIILGVSLGIGLLMVVGAVLCFVKAHFKRRQERAEALELRRSGLLVNSGSMASFYGSFASVASLEDCEDDSSPLEGESAQVRGPGECEVESPVQGRGSMDPSRGEDGAAVDDGESLLESTQPPPQPPPLPEYGMLESSGTDSILSRGVAVMALQAQSPVGVRRKKKRRKRRAPVEESSTGRRS